MTVLDPASSCCQRSSQRLRPRLSSAASGISAAWRRKREPAVGEQLLGALAQGFGLAPARLLRGLHHLADRAVDQGVAEQLEIAGDPRPLVACGLAHALHDQPVALVHQLPDRQARGAAGGGPGVLGHQQRRPVQAAIQERGVELGVDRRHARREQRLAHGRIVAVTVADLDQPAVVQHGRAHAEAGLLEHDAHRHCGGLQPRPVSSASVSTTGKPTTLA